MDDRKDGPKLLADDELQAVAGGFAGFGAGVLPPELQQMLGGTGGPQGGSGLQGAAESWNALSGGIADGHGPPGTPTPDGGWNPPGT